MKSFKQIAAAKRLSTKEKGTVVKLQDGYGVLIKASCEPTDYYQDIHTLVGAGGTYIRARLDMIQKQHAYTAI